MLSRIIRSLGALVFIFAGLVTLHNFNVNPAGTTRYVYAVTGGDIWASAFALCAPIPLGVFILISAATGGRPRGRR